MKITSMDITNKQFKKSMRGYNCDEVDEFWIKYQMIMKSYIKIIHL